MYNRMASSISDTRMYSSAVCERDECPGPILTDGNFIKAWSDKVGEPNGMRPIAMARFMSGCSKSMRDEFKRNERALASLWMFLPISSNISSFE